MADYMNPNAVVSGVGGGPQAVQRTAGDVNLDALTDEELDKLYRDYAGEEETNLEQLAEAEALRGTAGPQGRQIGRMYLAANPLEHMGTLANRGVGSYQAQQARDNRAGMGTDKQSALMALAKSRRGGAAPVTGGGAMSGWGSGLNALNMQVK